jgi:hypothetical protein
MSSDRLRDDVENIEVARQSAVVVEQGCALWCGELFGEWRQQTVVRGKWTRGYVCWADGLVSLPANGNIQTIGRLEHNISDILYKYYT